jgi:hypothetical protein
VARLDPETHRIEAVASVVVSGGSDPAVFEVAAALRFEEVSIDGRRVAFEVEAIPADPKLARVTVRGAAGGTASRRFTFRYAGTIHDPPQVARFSRNQVADQTRGTIQPEGVFLMPDAGWYPRATREPGTFRLEVSVPAGWDAVAEGRLEAREPGPAGSRITWSATQPTDGLHLVAGRWRRIESEHHGVTVAAYVFPEDEALAESYLGAVKRYLDLYGGWFGPYAFDRFSVVENFFSTGYGMAGFTVLGQDVMRLPFIVDTSLGHEVAHAWWGNAVFVDPAGGNWSEGLTTYIADHHYRRLKSEAEGAEYRRETCRDYTNYVSQAGKDFPLAEFTERTTAATRAVGYGKTLMVFRMLEERLGKPGFDRALRAFYKDHRFRRASWDTLRTVFSKEAGEDLGWFFNQWVRRSGAPEIALEGFRVTAAGDGTFDVAGTVVQRGGTWRLRLPLVYRSGSESERQVVVIDAARTQVTASLAFRPETLWADPDQDVFRRLDPAEIPPVLSRVLGDPRAAFVVHDRVGESLAAAYRGVADTLAQSGLGEVIPLSQANVTVLAGRNVLFLGLPPEGPLRGLVAGLPAEVEVRDASFRLAGTEHHEPGASVLAVGRRAEAPDRAVAVFHGFAPEGVREAGRKLVHYGKYSYLAFVDGKNVAKGVAPADGGPTAARF